MRKYKKIDCFAQQKFLLLLLGLSINQNIFYKIYCIILFIILTIYPISVLPEIIKLLYDFNELIHSSLFEIAYMTALLSTYCMIYNKNRMAKIFDQVQHLAELANFAEQGQQNAKLKHYENMIKKQSIIGIILGVFALLPMVLLSIFFSREKNNWILPFGSGPSINNNNVRFLSQSIIFHLIGSLFMLIMFVFINMLTILCCHCKILQNLIKNILKNSLENFVQNSWVRSRNNLSDIFIPWKFIKLELKKLVTYHVCIIELAAEVEKAFYIISLIVFLGVSMVICMAMLQLASNSIEDKNFVKNITLLAVSYFVMWVVSYRGEQVQTESKKIAEACSEINFIGSDLRLQRSLIMIIRQGQKPIVMTLGKVKTLGLATIVAVFQTCYSYYTLLTNIKK